MGVLGIIGAKASAGLSFALAGRSRMLVVGLFGASRRVRNAIVGARATLQRGRGISSAVRRFP